PPLSRSQISVPPSPLFEEMASSDPSKLNRHLVNSPLGIPTEPDIPTDEMKVWVKVAVSQTRILCGEATSLRPSPLRPRPQGTGSHLSCLSGRRVATSQTSTPPT